MANKEHVKILRQSFEVWNKWRKENWDIVPDLSGAKLSMADLSGADLSGAILSGANLSGAHLWNANLHGANLSDANLSGANLSGANLSNAYLYEANLTAAELAIADLSKADLRKADLSGAKLRRANLRGADLSAADLMNADLSEANLSGTFFRGAKLQGAVFYGTTVDGGTWISECEVDRDTNFELVGLGDMKIDSGTRQLLEYNLRRKQWDEWFGKGWLGKQIVKNLLVRPFWWMSNYGLSTKRVIVSFIFLSGLFAAVYSNLECFCSPGVVENLHVEEHEPLWHYGLLLIARPMYFSVVTMTTLGFGDIYAEKQSILGHILLTIQVLLGYVMLGALVTRFAVLFTAGGPAGKFVSMSKKEKRKLKDIREKQESERLKAAKEKKDTEDKQK